MPWIFPSDKQQTMTSPLRLTAKHSISAAKLRATKEKKEVKKMLMSVSIVEAYKHL